MTTSSSRSVIRTRLVGRLFGIKFGFIAYDLFNESLGGVGGVAIDRNGVGTGDVDSGRWRTRARGVASAHETGIAYVRKVRFADGELWIADQDALTVKLNELVPGRWGISAGE